MNLRKSIIILINAFVGWVLCAATMGIGLAITSLQNALIIHAVGAPIYFALVSLFYFKKFNYTIAYADSPDFRRFCGCHGFFRSGVID